MGPKPKNNTTYRPQWRTEVHTNLDGIEELYDWVSPAPNDTSKVKCSLCVKSIPFSISNGGISDCKQHARGQTHRLLIKARSNSRSFCNNSSNKLSLSLCDKDAVTKAETLQALKVVDSNLSFASSNGDAERFQSMFPDSEIAKKYSQEETKTKYVIQFGVARYVKSTLMKDFSGSPFSFKFDETTTTKVQKQYDGYITYISPIENNRVVTRYVGSLFVGHCTAADLRVHFYEFMKELELDTDLLLGIGLDGPNVNLRFQRELAKELEKDKGNSFLPIGTCALHIVNNAFGEGMKVIKSLLDIEQFLVDLHSFFKLSSARRQDYSSLEEVTDVVAHFMLRYCSTRWLYIGKTGLRVMEQIPNLKLYFLTELPKGTNFKGKKGVGSSERYLRIKKMLESDLLLPCLSFVVYSSLIFKPFVLTFQKEEPMIHMLYPQMRKLVQDLLVKFVDKKVMKDLAEVDAMLDFDVKKEDNHLALPEMGTKTKSLLNDMVKDKLDYKKFVESIVTSFYVTTTGYLLDNLPLKKAIIRDAQFLHPNQRRKKVEKPLLRLVGEVAKCLGESYYDVFGVEKSCSVDDLKDIIKTEISFYRMETIPETFYMNQKHASENGKEAKKSHKSYWKVAYEIFAGVEEEEVSEDDIFRRVDSYWTDVSLICDEVTGKPKYPKLSKLAFCILVLPHGNAEPERGFSINKLMLGIHGTSLDDDTIIALRLVKDHLLKCDGIMNFKITQDLLKSVQQSNQRYSEYLKVKAENKKKAEEQKEKKRLEALEASKINDEQEKRRAKIKQHEKDRDLLKEGIAVAEEVLSEVNMELGKQCDGKSIDAKKVKRCQIKLSMAMDRKRQLEAEVLDVEKKIRKLGS